MEKHYKGFKLHRGYRKVTVWTFDSKTNELIGTGTSAPFAKFSRKEKYKILSEHLSEEGLVIGPYKPLKSKL